jgi:hypothetical protein
MKRYEDSKRNVYKVCKCTKEEGGKGYTIKWRPKSSGGYLRIAKLENMPKWESLKTAEAEIEKIAKENGWQELSETEYTVRLNDGNGWKEIVKTKKRKEANEKIADLWNEINENRDYTKTYEIQIITKDGTGTTIQTAGKFNARA